ncbi:MAG: hypothetical protein JXR89_13120 [Deltaproteobacteria bacterium]|nr:hypothetical protein [Deltaproteobacteria bacterium]
MKKRKFSAFCAGTLLLLWNLTAGALEPDFFSGCNDRLERAGIGYRGFIDLRSGRRLVEAADEQQTSLAESRLQLEINGDLESFLFKIKGELLGDAVDDFVGGRLREAFFLVSPLPFADLKIGRQIMTWGAGDLLFINDLFPKDWEAFFIGRDDEYLKAPADAVRLGIFLDTLNLDIIYMPRFNPSNYIDGNRLSYWSPGQGRIAGRTARLVDDQRQRWFDEDEIALRAYRNFSGLEAAVYFYDGYWKTPEGMKSDGCLYFPRLRAFGLSLRGNLGAGLAHCEAGYYDSREDQSGENPLVRNREWRFLVGYEQELASDFTGGLQYYLEYMDDYDNYRAALPTGAKARDELRHLLTLRLTKLALQQNLKFSLFVFYSPSDNDAHLRPQISYKLNDDWLVVGGANLFYGRADHSFFGQFEENGNLYLGLRRNF